jgi:hypothetical protein
LNERISAEPLVAVVQVSSVEPEGDALLGASVDQPRAGAGGIGNTYAFDFEGWVVGRHSRARSVRLIHEDMLFLELPLDIERPDVVAAQPGGAQAERAGFRARLGSLRLPTEFELVVKAELEDGTRETFATISGRRQPLRSGYDARLRPLMVTTIGRTGSNLLLELLSAHPQVAACPPFDYEAYVASYWMSVLQELAEPASYLRQIVPEELTRRGWWLGTQQHHPQGWVGDDIHEWIGFGAVQDIAAFAQHRIDWFYGQLAASQGRSDAAFFAEKSFPYQVPRLAWELYGDMREIFLVRDFRDMMSSIFAFNERYDANAFGKHRVKDDLEHVRVQTGVTRALVRSWRERMDGAHLVHYEDLVLQPAETIEGILDYLGVDSSPEAKGKVLDRQRALEAKHASHGTSRSPEASIGRWRSELPPEVLETCDEVFREAMELFGYPRSTEAAPSSPSR